MTKMLAAATAAFLAFSASATAQSAEDSSATFLGIALGSPPPPECTIEQLQFGIRVYTLSGASFPCWQEIGSPTGRGLPNRPTYTLYVMTDPDSKPDGLGRVMAEVINGRVESISVPTAGFTHQEALLSALSAKFGKPSKLERTPVTTGVGAKFERISAEWSGANLHVHYFGMLSSIDEGSIAVRTDLGWQDFQTKYGSKERSF